MAMHRNTFATLALLAFGLVVVSFVVMGFSRIVLSYRTARLLAAPFLTVAALLGVGLFAYSVMIKVGVREWDEE